MKVPKKEKKVPYCLRLSKEDLDQAKKHKINIAEVCRQAIKRALVSTLT